MITHTERSMRRIQRYCREPIENIKNYDKAVSDTKNRYLLHHINELTFTQDELKKMNMYYNRPASELVWVTDKEHFEIHKHCVGWNERYIKRSEHVTGIPMSEEHRRNCSIGKKIWWDSEAGQRERERRRKNAHNR